MVAVKAAPTSLPTAVFSGMERVAEAPSENTGAAFATSVTSVTLIVTAMESEPCFPSETVSVTDRTYAFLNIIEGLESCCRM